MSPTPDPEKDGEQWTMVVCAECGTPWEVDGGPTCDHDRAETAELAVVPLARLAEVEQERDVIRDRYDKDVHDFWGLNEKAKGAEARAEAAETALREVRVWLQACDHAEECPASSRKAIEPCLCGLTQALKRTRIPAEGAG